MRRVILSLIVLSVFSYNVAQSEQSQSKVTVDDYYMMRAEKTVKNANEACITNYLKTRKLYLEDYAEIDSVLYPLIRKSVDEFYRDSFPYEVSKKEFTRIVEVVALSEGSLLTKKGIMPFKSILFIKGNNPFGIQGTGITVPTYEYIGGVKIRMYLPFQRFNSFKEGIFSLFELFNNKRYDYLKTVNTGTDFFYGMKRCGYFTSPTHHKTFFIPYYKKISRINHLY